MQIRPSHLIIRVHRYNGLVAPQSQFACLIAGRRKCWNKRWHQCEIHILLLALANTKEWHSITVRYLYDVESADPKKNICNIYVLLIDIAHICLLMQQTVEIFLYIIGHCRRGN